MVLHEKEMGKISNLQEILTKFRALYSPCRCLLEIKSSYWDCVQTTVYPQLCSMSASVVDLFPVSFYFFTSTPVIGQFVQQLFI